MKVLLVNSTPTIRKELRMLLDDQPDIQILEEADDPPKDGGLRLVKNLSPDVVVFEFQQSFRNDAETLSWMLALKPDLKIIVLSMQSDRRYLNECLKAGICGYLLKDCASEELIDAVRAVAANRRYLSRDIRLGKK